MRYCVDTNFFIECWHRHYWPNIFPSLWNEFEIMITNEEIISSVEVFKELEKKDDDLLFKWAKNRRDLFLPIDMDTQIAVGRLIANFPNFIKQTKRSGNNSADAFVVAVADVNGATVVTDEGIGSESKPKITNLCQWLDVPFISTKEFIQYHAKQKGWEF